MSGGARPLDPWRWLGLPVLTCIAATVIFAVPLRVFGLKLPEPIWPMWAVFAWPIIRPSLLAPFCVLVLGVFLDVFWGGPMGFWALSLLVAYAAVLGARNMMVGQGQLMMAIWYAGVTALAMGAGYLFSMMKLHEFPNLTAVGWQFLATLVLYPFADRLIEEFEDADVRFR